MFTLTRSISEASATVPKDIAKYGLDRVLVLDYHLAIFLRCFLTRTHLNHDKMSDLQEKIYNEHITDGTGSDNRYI